MTIYPSSAEEKLGFDVLRARLDGYARSTLGQSRMNNMRPSSNIEWVRAELERVTELQQAFQFDDPVPLDHILDLRQVLRRAAPEEALVSPEDLLAVLYVLSTLRKTRQYFEGRSNKYPRLSTSVSRITPLPEVEARISRVVDEEGQVRDSASPELARLRRQISQRQAQLREVLNSELRRAIGQGYATEDQPTIRNGRMVIPVRAEARRKVAGFVQDVSATGQTVYIEPAASLELNNELRELEAEEHREVERILREAAGFIRAHMGEMRTNLKALAQFDVLQAKARLANEIGAVMPQLNADGVIDIRQGRNPVLILHFRQLQREQEQTRHVVPLDLSLGGEYRTLVITGPNAGGKTVAMKSVGLFCLMLAYGLPLPVDPLSQMCVFEDLIVDIGDEQSIEEDLSTFSSHVANLKYMLRHAGPGTLILIDEAGTGTDPAEGGALAQAVLERLTEAGARTIATTHHGTLKVFAHETPLVENGSMQFDRATLSPTYRFLARLPGSSFAFEIAQRIGLDRNVLDRSRELAGGQKTMLEDLISTLQGRNQELEERLREAQMLQREADKAIRIYQERADRISRDRDEIRRQALEEAERLVNEANARVERTIREIKEAQAEKEATRIAREQLDTYRKEVAARKRRADRRRERSTREPGPTLGPRPATQGGLAAQTPGPLSVGDQVILDGGNATAEVLEIQDGEAVIALGSMRIRARLSRLQKVGGPRKQQVTVREVRDQNTRLSSLSARSAIDLRGQRVDEAMQEVTTFIDQAVAANLSNVEILHGKGTGALRESIREYLAKHPDVASFEDAPWNQGGPGVTLVTLK